MTKTTTAAALTVAAIGLAALTTFNAPGYVSAAENTETQVCETCGATQGQGYGKSNGQTGQGKGYGRQAALAEKAALIGISVEELQAAYDSGKSLSDIATENGITLDDWYAKQTARHQERLAELVAAGTLTQQEADARLAAYQANQGECDGEVHSQKGRALYDGTRGQGKGQGRGQGRGQQ